MGYLLPALLWKAMPYGERQESVEISSRMDKSHSFRTYFLYFVIIHMQGKHTTGRSCECPLRQRRHCSPQVSSPAIPSWGLKPRGQALKVPLKEIRRTTQGWGDNTADFKMAPSYAWLTSSLPKEQRPQKMESHQGDVTVERMSFKAVLLWALMPSGPLSWLIKNTTFLCDRRFSVFHRQFKTSMDHWKLLAIFFLTSTCLS